MAPPRLVEETRGFIKGAKNVGNQELTSDVFQFLRHFFGLLTPPENYSLNK